MNKYKLLFKKVLFLSLLSIIIFAPSYSFSKQENNQLYNEARKSFLKFNNIGFNSAINSYKNLIIKNPNDARAYAGLAEVYSYKGFFNKEAKSEYETEFNLANDYIKKAISINSKDTRILKAIAYLHLNLNRPKDALKIAKNLYSLEPGNYEYLFLYWAADGKKPEDNKINQVLQINPGFVIAHYELSKSYYRRRNNPTKGIDHIKKAIEISDSEKFRTLLGKMYRSKSKVYESIEQFDLALDMNKSYTPATINKGISLHYLQKYSESTKHLIVSEKVNKRFPKTYYFIGSNYYKLGNKEKARIFYNKFIKITKGQSKYNYYINQAKNNLAHIN